MRKLFACNPFYLTSAALLLFGCYRVSMDTAFLKTEWMQLLFNFSSLQLYEILLVITAVFLARRSLSYDSTLLVVLENMLVFVPFIFISQAALIDVRNVRLICAIGVVIALLRTAGLKSYYPQLNLPARVLGIGTLLLGLNVALPLVYRTFGETKLGNNLECPAFYFNEYTWLLILPAAFAMANFLPYAKGTGSFPPQRRWLPAAAFALWLVATSVHVYSLGYVYDFTLRAALLAPTLWVLAWTAFRYTRNIPALSQTQLNDAVLLTPALAPLLAAPNSDAHVFLALCVLNTVLYAVVCFSERDRRMARHLLFVSLLMVAAGLPQAWLHSVAPGMNRERWISAAAMAYLIAGAALSRNPKLAIGGSILLGISVMALFGNHSSAIHWAFQSASVFLLLHSLRWCDTEHAGATAVRVTFSLVWLAQSVAWMRSDDGRFWMPMIFGSGVLLAYSVVQLLRRDWQHRIVPITATLVALSGVVAPAANTARSMSSGLWAVIGSFVLFGCGTIAALTRHRWHHGDEARAESQQP